MADVSDLLEQLEDIAARLDELPESARPVVAGLLDTLDTLHRSAVIELATALGEADVDALSERHPAIAWLFEAYLRDEELAEAEQALETVRPFIHSHGGDVEVLAAEDGVVRVRLSGACSGCTASAITLRHGVEEALAERMPHFRELEVEEDASATPHPPPGPTLLDEERSLPIHPS